jgi:hypothetical protein
LPASESCVKMLRQNQFAESNWHVLTFLHPKFDVEFKGGVALGMKLKSYCLTWESVNRIKFFWLCTFFEQHCGGCEYIHDLGEKEIGGGLITALISSNWSGLRCACMRNCVVHESWVIAVVWVAGNHGAWKQDSLFEGNWGQDRKHMWFQLVGYVRPIGSKADGMQTPEQIIEHQKPQGQVVVQWCQVNSLWDSAGNVKGSSNWFLPSILGDSHLIKWGIFLGTY